MYMHLIRSDKKLVQLLLALVDPRSLLSLVFTSWQSRFRKEDLARSVHQGLSLPPSCHYPCTTKRYRLGAKSHHPIRLLIKPEI